MNNSPIKRLRIQIHRWLIPWGVDIRKRRNDRKLLEQIIFPEILRTPQYQTILFVGCAWYTLHYPRIFGDRNFITMEISPEEAPYGGPTHIIDSCEHIDRHFPSNSLDVIVLNGVYGFGLNQLPAIEQTLRCIYDTLAPDGLFIFGWNDMPSTAPYEIERLTGLNAFEPYAFPPLATSIYESDPTNKHRYHFYRKSKS
jgi:SAM-dependent methyltransferase